MSKDVNSDYNFKAWVVFHQAAVATNKVREAELFKYGISRIQVGILFVVKNSNEPLSPTQISRRLIQEPHSTAELLNRMEKHGLIKKTKDPLMKNIKRVTLTEKGEEIYREVMKIETIDELLSCLSPEEITTLLTCSKKLRDEALKHLPNRHPWQLLFDSD